MSDHNCDGQSRRIWHSLHKLGYADWLEIEIKFFENVGLSSNSSDEEVWLYCQQNNFYLLTGNRSTKAGAASLHAVLDRLVNEKSLPVITIGDLNRVIHNRVYCEACAEAIAEIVLNAELYVGVSRLYIP